MLKQKTRLEPKLFADPFTGGPTPTRNALVVGGRVIPFDTVWREVPAAAFLTNPQLRRAREQIEPRSHKPAKSAQNRAKLIP